MEWARQKVVDAPLDIIDGDRGVNYPKKTDFLERGHCLFLNAGNVTINGFDFSENAFINEERDNLLRKGKLKKYDVVLTTRGTVGNVGYYDDSVRYNHLRINSGMVIFRAKEDELLSSFLYLYLRSPLFKNQVAALTTGSAQPQLPIRDINRINIPLPPLAEQKAIASVLGALDDKIENNRRMNETLEEMAQAIFKSWFVDFDPIHAKAAGNQPAHMDSETAALFPSTFNDDGLPEGWTEKTLRDFAIELESGKRPKGGIDKSLNEGVPSIGAESLLKIGDFEYSKLKYVKKEFAEKSSKGWVKNYDVAIYKDGANVGDPTRVSLFGNGFPFDKFMVNEHVFLIRSKSIGQPFLYSLFQSAILSQQLHSMGTSKAAQPGFNQQEVLSCEFVAPNEELFDVFNRTILPLVDRRLAIGKENQTLAKLRDTLLPKLMSGEIRVAEAEQELEAVA